MYWTLFKNDIKNNPLQSFNIAFFIILSVAFLSVAGQLAIQLNNSVHTLFENAKTPHLLQMHSGEIDRARMDLFVKAHPEIEEYQILEFLNVDASLLSFNKHSLKDYVYDNGFSVQSPKFDFLLDLKGKRIQPKDGEVYVPVFYQNLGLVQEGDFLNIREHKLRVAGFVRDSQMNASLSVSKRFIVSENEYQKLEKWGKLEYLIEFRLHDLAKSSALEAAYAEANLESNGPPFLSYQLFKLVNAFSDGIAIIALFLVGLLIIGISFLCIRFTLLAKLEEDYKELAVLKAIGLPLSRLKHLFLAKYLFIAGIASIGGFLVSFYLKRPFLNNMKIFFGETKENGESYLVGFVLSVLVFLVIYLYMNYLAKRLQTLTLNETSIADKGRVICSLSALPKVLQLVVSDFLFRRKMYFTLILVFVLSLFVLTIPMSIYATISDKNFVNYLGVGTYEIRVDISAQSSNEKEINTLLEELKKDTLVKKVALYTSQLVDYKTEEGKRQKLWIDSGNQSQFPIQYIFGKAPLAEDEIALSKLASDELGKKEGDRLILLLGEKERPFVVSGIYSDLTNGGKSAKINFEIDSKDETWTMLAIGLKERVKASELIKAYQKRYFFAKFTDTETYLNQIFGNTIEILKKTTLIALVISLFLIFLIVGLFVRMMYLKDRGQNAILKALGFNRRDLYLYYRIKILFSLLVGLLIGYFLIWTVGDKLMQMVLSFIGVYGVHFVRQGFLMYLLLPFLIFISAFLATNIGVKGLKEMNIADFLKEE